MTTTTTHCHIVQDDQILSGEPIVKGTRTSVRAIIELWRMGIAPEEMLTHLPYLTLGQVFDALSYFSDHPDQIELAIQRNSVPPQDKK